MDNQLPSRLQEIIAELKMVFAGRGKIIDSVFPPIIFLIVNTTLGFEPALWSSLGVALLIGVLRAIKRQPLAYAFAGVGGVLVAVLIARVLGRSEGFFLPGLVTGSLTAGISLISLIAKRPLVAWTSYLTRRWPLDWYWHDRVRPAYSEVTIAWTLFFAARLLWQVSLFQERAADRLAFVNALLGWPALIILLVLSYLYGTWRLKNLDGPSVEEFKQQVPPPWQGQQRGF